jgi:hypothetical protein
MFSKKLSIADACSQAADLIVSEGFATGGAGWVGNGGWCIEGALARVYGIPLCDAPSMQINASPAGLAIKRHLGYGGFLYHWNDRHTQRDVIRVLKEVAAKHSDQPVTLPVVAEVTTETTRPWYKAAWFKALGWDKPVSAAVESVPENKVAADDSLYSDYVAKAQARVMA